MSTIPTSVTEDQFDEHIRLLLSTAKRGYVCQIPLVKVFNDILYRLHTGCQWAHLPTAPARTDPEKKRLAGKRSTIISRTWSADGSLQQVWEQSIQTICKDLDVLRLNLDGSHTLAEKGGESVAYPHRKRAKTSNLLPITDAQGDVLASTGGAAGNPHDAFDLKPHLQAAFKHIKHLGLTFAGAYFNADSAFDTLEARKVCFNHQVIPNICENKRNRKATKRGRKHLFNPTLYKQRSTSERSFAWIDKFRALLIHYDGKDVNFLGAHHLAFALINLRHLFARKG